MKKLILTIAVLLALSLLGGCGKTQAEPTVTPETSTESTVPPAAETEADETVYAQQIQRYYEALSARWDEGTYFDREMSAMAAYYYEGNALDNVGYALADLDGDNVRELIIGAILNAEQDPLVFEIWTLTDGKPVMLAQSGSRNRYYMQYAEDDGLWSVAYEAENGAANRAVYYLQPAEGALAVVQGIVFDAVANESAPWFMTYDMDWDVSNDTPVDEATANAVLEAGRNTYTAMEYRPYSLYK